MDDSDGEDLVQIRDIGFHSPHPDPRRAESATRLVAGLPGVLRARAIGARRLRIRYHLAQVCLCSIEACLVEHGFHLEGNVLARLQRAVVHYAEETLRANLACPRGSGNCTQKVFVNRYRHRDHGCRDSRPTHWRQYL
jgi:hypothetical protein